MLGWKAKPAMLATLGVLLTPLFVFAAAGGGEAIVFVADSRRFTGWRAGFTNLYNESLLSFTLVTVITIPVLALVLGAITNFFLARTGINLKSRILAEH